MNEFVVASYRVRVTRAEGDDRSLEFDSVGVDGEEARFAIYVDLDELVDCAVLSIDPQTPEVPLVVIAWASAYAQAEL